MTCLQFMLNTLDVRTFKGISPVAGFGKARLSAGLFRLPKVVRNASLYSLNALLFSTVQQQKAL